MTVLSGTKNYDFFLVNVVGLTARILNVGEVGFIVLAIFGMVLNYHNYFVYRILLLLESCAKEPLTIILLALL